MTKYGQLLLTGLARQFVNKLLIYETILAAISWALPEATWPCDALSEDWGSILNWAGPDSERSPHQIAPVLSIEIGLIEALLHGRRGWGVGVFLTSLMVQTISTRWGHSYHRYAPAALPAKHPFSTLLQVLTLHFGTASFLMYHAVFLIFRPYLLHEGAFENLQMGH